MKKLLFFLMMLLCTIENTSRANLKKTEKNTSEHRSALTSSTTYLLTSSTTYLIEAAIAAKAALFCKSAIPYLVKKALVQLPKPANCSCGIVGCNCNHFIIDSPLYGFLIGLAIGGIITCGATSIFCLALCCASIKQWLKEKKESNGLIYKKSFS